jgi:hypothetical protein
LCITDWVGGRHVGRYLFSKNMTRRIHEEDMTYDKINMYLLLQKQHCNFKKKGLFEIKQKRNVGFAFGS